MNEYYVFQTMQEEEACITTINSSGWFPIVGNKNGKPNPSAQQTTCWCKEGREMLSGERAVPRIPEDRLDFLGVSKLERDEFLMAFGQDIRQLSEQDFPQVDLEI